MRMRKKKWALPFIQNDQAIMISEPALNQGKWKTLFENKPLALEIGIGKGGYIRKMAALHPEMGFIGIEKDTNCVAVALKDVHQEGLNNIKLINQDAQNLALWFNKGEIQVLYLNFSDPWPKKGHTKRRLSSSSFLQIYDTILSDDGFIVMKTDNKSLFEYSLISFLDYGFKLTEFSVDFKSQDNNDPITEYEQKFLDLNQPIYRMKLSKKRG